jgi:hypothetical protein
MPIAAIILKDDETLKEVRVEYAEPDNLIIKAEEPGINVYLKDLFSAGDLLKAAYWHDRNQPPVATEAGPPVSSSGEPFMAPMGPGIEIPNVEWGSDNDGTVGE